jgi:hypothetical protein
LHSKKREAVTALGNVRTYAAETGGRRNLRECCWNEQVGQDLAIHLEEAKLSLFKEKETLIFFLFSFSFFFLFFFSGQATGMLRRALAATPPGRERGQCASSAWHRTEAAVLR